MLGWAALTLPRLRHPAAEHRRRQQRHHHGGGAAQRAQVQGLRPQAGGENGLPVKRVSRLGRGRERELLLLPRLYPASHASWSSLAAHPLPRPGAPKRLLLPPTQPFPAFRRAPLLGPPWLQDLEGLMKMVDVDASGTIDYE